MKINYFKGILFTIVSILITIGCSYLFTAVDDYRRHMYNPYPSIIAYFIGYILLGVYLAYFIKSNYCKSNSKTVLFTSGITITLLILLWLFVEFIGLPISTNIFETGIPVILTIIGVNIFMFINVLNTKKEDH